MIAIEGYIYSSKTGIYYSREVGNGDSLKFLRIALSYVAKL